MRKKVMKRVLIAILIIVLLIICGASGVYYWYSGDRYDLLQHIKDNPQQSAVMLSYEGQTRVSLNVDQKMPLASTVKILIAIEYAEQVEKQALNPNELIPLHELDRYYLAGTDGGAHPAWLGSLNDGQITNDEVRLHDIAKGMIQYSSNANTEYLMSKLGLDNINQQIKKLELKNHDPLYPIVSCLFIFRNESGESDENFLAHLKNTSMEKYRLQALDIHQQLKRDSNSIDKENLAFLDLAMQRIWSDRLPGSSVSDYVSIMKKLNSKSYFSAKVHEHLDPVMEAVMQNPANQQWLKHSGMKGGSTVFILTKALYATDKKGRTYEMAYFLNDLHIMSMSRLSRFMNDFELGILSDDQFRNEVIESHNLGTIITLILIK